MVIYIDLVLFQWLVWWRSSRIGFFYIYRFCFATNNNQVPVFVSDTSVACAGVRSVDSFNLDFLPASDILVPYLLNNADWINVVEKHLTSSLAPVNVNLIIHDAAAVRIPGLRDVTNLLALIPSKRLNCKVFDHLGSSVSEFWKTCNFTAPNGRLIPVHFSAEADQYPGVIEAFFILIQASMNDHQIADYLADMSFTWLRCILGTS